MSRNNPILEESASLSKMRDSELHRLLKEYRFIHAMFSKIGGIAKNRVAAIQSVLMRRGSDGNGKAVAPTNMRHPAPNGEISITDHALVRYLQRVKGIDIEEVEDEMIERIKRGETFYGGSIVVDKDDICYVLRADGLVVSAMPHDWMSEVNKVASQTARERGRRPRKSEASG